MWFSSSSGPMNEKIHRCQICGETKECDAGTCAVPLDTCGRCPSKDGVIGIYAEGHHPLAAKYFGPES